MKNRYRKAITPYNVLSAGLMAFAVFVVGASQVFAQGPGNALNFGGTDEYVDFGAGPGGATQLQIAGNLTIETWANIPVGPGDNSVFALITYGTNGEDESTNQLYRLQIADINTDGAIEYRYQMVHESGAGTDVIVTFTNTSPVFGSWKHVAVTRDTVQNQYILYVNGVFETQTYQDNLDPSGGTSGIGILGAGFSGTQGVGTNVPQGGFLIGKMDEVRIWHVVRSVDSIRANMCRKIAGNKPGLQGYWRLDESSGTIAPDLTANNNNGTLVNMEDGDWVTSGAPIGDASIADYGPPSSVNLAHSDGDDVTINNFVGNPSGAHIYRVDEAPNVTTPPGSLVKLDPLRYWGVFIVGGTSPTYDLIYNYGGHPGISNESSLDLASRADNSVTSWTERDATLNEAANTLTLAGESGTEYILGSETSDNSLPVQLASFDAKVFGRGVQLNWVTHSEINNLGFEIWRSTNSSDNFQLLASYETDEQLKGAGNSNTTRQYSYTDKNIEMGQTYYYQLWDVSFAGERTHLKTVEVEAVASLAEGLALFQNYPNPFNAETIIRFQLPVREESTMPVSLNIFDPLGRKIRTLVSGQLATGQEHQAAWDGRDDTGNIVASGVYVYTLESGDAVTSRKLMMIR